MNFNHSLRQYFESKNPHEDFSSIIMTLENRIIPTATLFTGVFDCAIEFSNCYFQEKLIFQSTELKYRLAFRQCFFDKEIEILKGSVFADEFDLAAIHCAGQVFVQDGKFENCRWGIHGSRVLINGGSFASLNIGFWGGSFLKELSFDLRQVSGAIKVTGDKSEIQRLDLVHFSSDVSIALEDIRVNSLSIYRYRNEKSLRIMNLKALAGDKPTELSIAESYLGKAEFYSIDFSIFEKVNFIDDHLVDCSFVNITWSKNIFALKGRYIGKTSAETSLLEKIRMIEENKIENADKVDELKKDPAVLGYYQKSREVYRQIKYALSKQGDTVNEQKFHSKEMMAYNRTLFWYEDFSTKMIVKLSYWFSDFGQSITGPIAALLIGHGFLLATLILTGGINSLKFSLEYANSSGLREAFFWYFKLINPFRKIEDVSGYFMAIDILMRIWSSYMIYNIVRASRRFIK